MGKSKFSLTFWPLLGIMSFCLVYFYPQLFGIKVYKEDEFQEINKNTKQTEVRLSTNTASNSAEEPFEGVGVKISRFVANRVDKNSSNNLNNSKRNSRNAIELNRGNFSPEQIENWDFVNSKKIQSQLITAIENIDKLLSEIPLGYPESRETLKHQKLLIELLTSTENQNFNPSEIFNQLENQDLIIIEKMNKESLPNKYIQSWIRTVQLNSFFNNNLSINLKTIILNEYVPRLQLRSLVYYPEQADRISKIKAIFLFLNKDLKTITVFKNNILFISKVRFSRDKNLKEWSYFDLNIDNQQDTYQIVLTSKKDQKFSRTYRFNNSYKEFNYKEAWIGKTKEMKQEYFSKQKTKSKTKPQTRENNNAKHKVYIVEMDDNLSGKINLLDQQNRTDLQLIKKERARDDEILDKLLKQK